MIPYSAMSPAQTRVLLAVLATPVPRTVRSVATAVGLPLATTHGHLADLRRLGFVAWDQGRASTLRPLVEIVGSVK